MKGSKTPSNFSTSVKVSFCTENVSSKTEGTSLHSALKLTSNTDADSTTTEQIDPKVTIIKVIPEDNLPTVEIPQRSPRIFIDDLDWSCHPSYTNFELPYDTVCRLRYQKTVKKYNRQFCHELEMLETMQPSPYEAARFYRIFSITTLWPPLHTKKEIEYVLKNFYKIPPKQQTRINYLLKEEQV